MKDKYVVFDCETCNTPRNEKGQLDTEIGQVYDLGAQVIDNTGKVYEEISLVNQDVFFDMPQAMQEAYYAEKIPQYMEDLRLGKRMMVDTWDMWRIFFNLCKKWDVKAVIAHNARFDVTVLNATMRYQTKSKKRFFLPYDIPVWDTMRMANDTICKQSNYHKFCIDNGYMTNHLIPQVRKTAEVLWRYLTDNTDFTEQHTGLEDVTIEAQIFAACVRQHKKMERLAELDME